MAAPLSNAIDFLRDFGFFDIVLPFLLTFALMFAILQKTKILGEKKELDAMVAFVVGMLVTGTNKVVTIINDALPNIVVLVVGIIGFLILVGTFYKEGTFDFTTTHTKYVAGLSAALFLAIIAIFFNAIRTETGYTWLEVILKYVFENFTGTVVTSIVFLIVVIGAIYFIVGDTKTTAAADEGAGAPPAGSHR